MMPESNLHKKALAYKRNWYVCIKEIDLNCLDGVAVFFVLSMELERVEKYKFKLDGN